MRHRLFTLFFVVSAFVACNGTGRVSRQPLTPVQLSKAEPPSNCEMVGTVAGGGWSVDEAYSELRSQARRKHANYVVLDGIANGVFGRAFRCPVEAPATAATAAPAPRAAGPACEPECSPGFTCVRGACVSACNPPCEKGQRCDADRACHAAP
ncbi:MAG: hypothetical protein JWP87_3335 [Labilithrix sp.]|nr:hypothetical protein [Labilithrix sp.]